MIPLFNLVLSKSAASLPVIMIMTVIIIIISYESLNDEP